MKLRSKFINSSALILLIGLLITIPLQFIIVNQQARKDVEDRAVLALSIASAIRNYTSEHIQPLLADSLTSEKEFIPETAPAFAALKIFSMLQEQPDFASYAYQEATLNPINLDHLANPFEADLINKMRADTNLTEITGQQEGQIYVARPIIVSSENCLACHSSPDTAPASLIESYGSENGFGWQVGEIVGAQVVYVPANTVSREAFALFALPAAIQIAMAGLLLIAINYLLRRLVVKPVSLLETTIRRFRGGADPTELTELHELAKNTGEIGHLSHTFLNMIQGVSHRETALASANQKLQESEEANQIIIESLPEHLFLVQRDGQILFYQKGKENLLPIDSADVSGRNLYDLFPRYSHYLNRFQQILDEGQESVYRITEATSGGPLELELNVVPLGAEKGLVIVRNITREKERENAAIHTQKLESVGLLAGGIAHDFNNLLTGVIGQMSLAQVKMPSETPGATNVKKAMLSAERAAQLTRQLLAYAGEGTSINEPIQLDIFAAESTELLRSSVRKGIVRYQETAVEQPLIIEADKGHIQQILMNLVINASESLPASNGYVDVSVTPVTVDAAFEAIGIIGDPPAQGAYACLTVSDNGHGIPPEIKQQIFDPYFSTKGMGRGLGLSAVLGIIGRYHGSLSIQSSPETGTTMRVMLPLSKDATENPLQKQRTGAPTLPYINYTVLVVDDQQAVLESAVEMLTLNGCKVLTAVDGFDAIERYVTYRNSIDLILMDMELPSMNGIEVFEILSKSYPDLRIIFSSGYSRQSVFDQSAEYDEIAFLQKPYTVSQLTATIDKVMQGA